jgi:hypothetical protein
MHTHLQDLAERAVILEYDAGLPRTEAEAMAIAEYLDSHTGADNKIRGLLEELIRASRQIGHPDLHPVLEDLGLLNVRVPSWGVDMVVPDTVAGYRPAAKGKGGRWAFIAPVYDEDGLADLVAESLKTGRLLRRYCFGTVLGAKAIEEAREFDEPLFVFHRPSSWLRGHCLGAVVLDWEQIGHEFNGVRKLFCHASLASRLHEATRRCWPRPTIALPTAGGAQRAVA